MSDRAKLEAAAIGFLLQPGAERSVLIPALTDLRWSDPRAPAVLSALRAMTGSLDLWALSRSVEIPAAASYLDTCTAAADAAQASGQTFQRILGRLVAPPAVTQDVGDRLPLADYSQAAALELADHVLLGLPRGTVSFLHGQEGIGKTACALQLAVAKALGRPWFGQTTGGADRVLFIAQESGAAEVQARLRAQAVVEGWDVAELATRLAMVTERELEGRYLNLARDADRLHGTLRAVRPALVVVDHLSALCADEREDGQAVVVEQLRAMAVHHRAAFLILDHDNKTVGLGERASHAGRAMKRRISSLTLWMATDKAGQPFLEVGKAWYLPQDRRARIPLRWRSLPDPWERTMAGEPVTWGYLERAEPVPTAAASEAGGPPVNGARQGALLDLVGVNGAATPAIVEQAAARRLYGDTGGEVLARMVRRDLTQLAQLGEIEKRPGRGRVPASWVRIPTWTREGGTDADTP